MYKKILAICLSVIIAMSTAIVPVFADSFNLVISKDDDRDILASLFKPDKKDKDRDEDEDEDKIEDILKYFLDSDDIEWAAKSIEKMGAMGILNGKGNGFFKPSSNVTHAEAIAMVLKLTGLREEAESIKTSPTYFKDLCAPWSYGYLQLALDKGIIVPEEDEWVNPNTPAKRYEVAKYIVRALGRRDEALDNMDKKLSYKDANSIPKGARGYVYVITELDIMTGSNGSFQPNKPITRAEMAVLLDRAADKFDDSIADDNAYSGVFLSYDKNDSTITMKINNKETEYDVIPNAPVYKDNTYYTLKVLEPGDLIGIVLDSKNRIIFIEFKEEGTAPAPEGDELSIRHIDYSNLPDELQDKVDELKLTENYAAFKRDNYIYLIAARGRKSTGGYSIEIDEVYKDKVSSGKYNLRAVVETKSPSGSVTQAVTYPYDIVRLSYFNGIQKVNFVDSDNDLIEQTTLDAYDDVDTVKGTITSVDTSSRIIFMKDQDNKTKAYFIASNAQITLDGKKVSLSSLKENMTVVITLDDGYAVNIAAKTSEEVSIIKGRIKAVDTANRMITIKDTSSTTKIFYIPPKAQITLAGKTVNLSSLKENMPVELSIANGIVTKVEAEKAEAVEEIDGVITDVDAANRILYLENEDNVKKAYYIPAEAVITLNDKVVRLNSLTANMPVTVTRIDNIVTGVEAQNADKLETIKGKIVSVDAADRILSIKLTDNSTKAYYIPSDAKITLDNKAAALSALLENMTVTVTRINDEITSVAAQRVTDTETLKGRITQVDLANKLVYLKDSDNYIKTYYIPSSVKITLNAKAVNLSALKEDMTAVITRVNGVITKLEATQTVEKISGIIDSVDAEDRIVKLLENNNVVNSYTIPEDALVTLDSQELHISHLAKGMKAEITKVDDVITKIAAQNDVQSVQGVLIDIDTNENDSIIKVKVGTAYKSYVLTDEAEVFYRDQSIEIEHMPLNTTIIIKVINGTVTEVRNK